MKRISTMLAAFAAIGACCASTAALAENPVGFYLGAGVGESTIRSDDSSYGYPGYYNDHQTAWKAIAGIRPISLIGVEYEYIDFGRPYHHHGDDENVYGSDSHPHASALFGIGYLPIPIPFIDIYAKLGAARLMENLNSYSAVACTTTPCPNTILVSSRSVTNTKFAYGAGVQSKLPFGLTVRAEYERISSPYGDPDALTVSAVWTF